MEEFGSCDKCKYNNKSETEYPCEQCVHNAVDKFEPITNADKIRSMSDEELAEFLASAEDINESHWLQDYWLKWLQSEAE